ncbi:MAG TPA: translation initiation factor IF-2 [Bacillota bacterium]|nr:translation initiation factor IF-2 [Bacillota bacterium]
MAKVRVFELAKELDMPSKDLVTLLNELGVKAKNHMSAIDENAARYVMRKYGPDAKKAESPGEQPTQDVSEAPTAPPADLPRAAVRAEPVRGPADRRVDAGPQDRPRPAPATRPQDAGRRQGRPQGVPGGQTRPADAGGRPRRPLDVGPQKPLDPSYPFIPARPRPQGAGAPRPRPFAPVTPITPVAPAPPQQALQQPRPERSDRFDRAERFPRPAGPGPGFRRGPAVSVPPPPPSAVPAPGARGGGKGKQTWSGRGKRRGGLDDEMEAPRGDRRADRRGRKKSPTAAPLGDARLIERRVRAGDIDAADDVVVRRVGRRREKPTKVRRIEIGASIGIRDLAARLEMSAPEVVSRLIKMGVMANVNQEIEGEIAQILATDLGFEAELTSEREEREVAIAEIEDAPESLKSRPPVVTIMGHVDHGKTSLLDAIRETNVTATEAGGITQHIGAYQVELGGRKITFLDTPGHEAFTAMRARGAQATDVAVLVVAADDGVMPQTVEAINHARDANVPIVVAVNKVDKPHAQPERVQRQLSEMGLVPEEWGGETVMVPVSALQKRGIQELLEMILLVADMRDLKANPDRPAMGTVIEAKVDRGRGPVATVLIQKGTLRVGDSFLVGEVYGRVRAMANYRGEPLDEATPSMPVEVLGLSYVPEAGDVFQAVTDEREAKQVAEKRAERKRVSEIGETSKKVSLEDLFEQIKEGQTKELRVIIKADVQGSAEALKQSIEQLSTDEVRVNVIHSGVGAVTESDVMLASASNAVVIGFNVRPDAAGTASAEVEQVDVRLYRVIYEALDDVKKAMEGLLEPEYREVVLGHAEVRATFKIPKAGTVAGCYVTDGKIARSARVRLLRDGTVIHEGKISSLKRFKDDAREVAAGFECGIGIEGYSDVRTGDIIEGYSKEAVKREL